MHQAINRLKIRPKSEPVSKPVLNEALIYATTAFKISTISWLAITFIFSLPVSFTKPFNFRNGYFSKCDLGLAIVESIIPSKIIWIVCPFAIATKTLPLSCPSDNNKSSCFPGKSHLVTFSTELFF